MLRSSNLELENLKSNFIQGAGELFSEDALRNYIDRMEAEGNLSTKDRNKIQRGAKKLPLIWGKNAEFKYLSFKSDDYFTADDILIKITGKPSYYMSHFSALYLNDLTNQTPDQHYISRETKRLKPPTTKPLRTSLVRQAFMKNPRVTSHYFIFHNRKFFFIQKMNLSECGVISHNLSLRGSTESVRITDPERTILDSIISPHYSGGMATIVSIIKNMTLKLEKLYDYYKIIDPIYPFWQSIGLLLETSDKTLQSKDWEALFDNTPQMDFYLDRGFRSDWSYSKKWHIYFPPNILL